MSTQATRQLAISDLVGSDKLLLVKLRGVEECSRLFEYELEIYSEDPDVDPRAIVGKNVTLRLDRKENETRYFNGYVREFQHRGWSEEYTVYRAYVVPWTWFLTQTTDCRIFQHKSVPEIVEQIFQDLGFNDYRFQLGQSYHQREYCVQYRESDYDFVARLLEEEGIFYYFEHANGSHSLVLGDRASAYYELKDSNVTFPAPGQEAGIVDQVKQWNHRFRFHPGKFAHTDYNFKTPGTRLMCDESAVQNIGNNQAYELYDYHGRHQDNEVGRQLAQVRIQEQEAKYEVAEGIATYRSFSAGGRFRVKYHRVAAMEGKEYVLTKSEVVASDKRSYVTGPDTDDTPEYECRFECIPADKVYRPPRVTPKPVVEGPQTAVVVGPPGEEIYPDEFGRVKVQFHWDREGNFDHNSSCWVRVSQGHAGAGWGGIDLPRIGEEVIVDFIEGDPDNPMITGRVYNAQNMPPFNLPAEKTRSGMKSQTHKGSGYNEMSMDDTAGKEQIRTNAQYNMDTAVGNNQTLIVNNNRTADIGNNDSEVVGNNDSESVGNNKKVVVGNNMNVDVGSKLVMNAGSSITLKCGASRIHMTSGGLITITGTIITTAAAANAAVAAPLTQVVGAAMLTTVGGVNMMNGGVCHVGAAGLASVSGGKVDLVASGENSIKGGTITLN